MIKTNIVVLLVVLSVLFSFGCYRDVVSEINSDNDFIRVFSKKGKAILLITNPGISDDKIDLYARFIMTAKNLETLGWEMVNKSHSSYSGVIFILNSSNMLMFSGIKDKNKKTFFLKNDFRGIIKEINLHLFSKKI